ncbi:MAG: hypothetical protein ACLGHN_08115 [Bacteriovoracia bacterium]
MDWLPQVCGQLHGEMVTIYWILLLPLIVFLIILELFKTANQQPDAGKIIVRAITSILLLVSFKETINLIAFIGDGIAERIDGLAKMTKIIEIFDANLDRDAPSLYKLQEIVLFLLNFLSYFIAYFGIFIVEALIQFCWSVLYVCAPLMILCYVPEQTASISKNLYKGLLTIVTWKLIWSILGVMLLQLAIEPRSDQSGNLIQTAVINLCIALSIMLVPLFSKSLLGDGLSSFTSSIAAVPGIAALGVGKSLLSMPVKKGASWAGGSIKNRWNAISGRNKKQAPQHDQTKNKQRK